MDSNFNQRLKTAVGFYQGLGFFQNDEFSKLSKAEFLIKIGANHFRNRFAQTQDHISRPQVWEQELLAKDKTRVCWEDPEFVFENTHFYARLLERLAKISRGKFAPTHITEKWLKLAESEHPIISLSFEVDDQTYCFWINRCTDYARPEFIAQLNQIVATYGVQFWVYETDDWFIVCQTDDEVLKMLERGYKHHTSFENLTLDKDVLTYPTYTDETHALNWLESVITFLQDNPWDWEALFWPVYASHVNCQQANPSLYFQRGAHRYQQGDLAGSWHDFVVAAQQGYPNIKQRLISLEINYADAP